MQLTVEILICTIEFARIALKLLFYELTSKFNITRKFNHACFQSIWKTVSTLEYRKLSNTLASEMFAMKRSGHLSVYKCTENG